MKTCDKTNEQLTAFVLGYCSEQEVSEMTRHLVECEDCRVKVKEHGRLLECAREISEASVDEEICKSAKEAVLAAAEDVENADTGPAINIQNVRRIIMKRRMTKLAFAAVIIIGFMLTIYFGNGSIDIATPTFAQAIDNIKQTKCVHYVIENMKYGRVQDENWVSFESQTFVNVRPDGKITFYNWPTKRMDNYNPELNIITNLQHPDSGDDDLAPNLARFQSAKEYFDSFCDQIIKSSLRFEKRNSRFDNMDVIIYEAQTNLGSQVEAHEWIVNRQTNLPVKFKIKRTNDKGDIINHYSINIDYPNIDPRNIYEAGAPGSAKLDNRLPDEAVVDILDTYHGYGRETLTRYAAIMKEGDLPRYVVYRDGIKLREEYYELRIYGNDWVPQDDYQLEKMGDTFDSVFEWLQNSNIMACSDITVVDGNFSYNTSVSAMKEGSPPNQSLIYGWQMNRVEGDFWPQIKYEGKIVDNQYSHENSLICLEQERESLRYYINPQRGYILQRIESLDGSPQREVVEFDQTASGLWYPKVIKSSDMTYTFLVKELPTIEPNLFKKEM